MIVVPRLTLIIVLSFLVGCTSVALEPNERVATSTQRFESAEATLVDFEMDGRLVGDTTDPLALRPFIDAQLMYAVGQLNGERAVGWYERLEVSAISATPSPSGRYDVRYHAKLPVAWAAGSAPATYTLVLPGSVAAEDQVRFTEKYGTTCVDPQGGDLNAGGRPDAGRMFLFYRPQRPGCVLAPEDVSAAVANVKPSTENSTGKYPEYHRIWEDGALDFVAVFGIEIQDTPSDAGVKAFDDFLRSADAFLATLQTDETKRTTTSTIIDGRRRTRIEAVLADGRGVHVDAILIGPQLANEGAAFDAWCDAASFRADVIFYSGHAAHGANVRSLMTKGTFQPKKYLVWVVNGCDTLAYVDRTLADRRLALNPDDRSGTKYMDTVSNVLGAWFRMGDETAIRFVRDIVTATGANAAPKTYRQIFSGIDRDQIVVVTGEEDNEFPVTPEPVVVRSPTEEPSKEAGGDAVAPRDERPQPAREDSSCRMGRAPGEAPAAFLIAVAVGLLAFRRTRAPRLARASLSETEAGDRQDPVVTPRCNRSTVVDR